MVGPEIIYKIKMAFSKDGINWLKHDQNIIDDILGPNECQAGT